MLTKKRLLLLFLGMLGIIGGTIGVVAWAVFSVPDFYQEALAKQIPPKVRKEAARTFIRRAEQLADTIRHADQWEEEFTQVQINSWIEEDLEKRRLEWKPRGVSRPRLAFIEDTIQVGFQYEHDGWSGIVSLELKPKIQNQTDLAVEIQAIRAGLLPVPIQDVLRQLTERADNEGFEIRWEKSASGNDIAVIPLTEWTRTDNPLLEQVKIKDGKIIISGRGEKNRQTLNSSKFIIPVSFRL